MARIRWGILGAARIALNKVIPAMQRSTCGEVIAIASRDLAKAQAAAGRLAIPCAYGSYEDLVADPRVDAVYIPLPNHLHVPWSIKALEAGKHVLCEKPIALTSAEAQTLVDAGRNYPRLKLMEGFMYRFHPQWAQVTKLIAAGGIGELRTIQSFYSYYNVDPTSTRNIAEVGGGVLLDIGCYCISLTRFLYGQEPLRVLGLVEYDGTFKTDRLASGILDFGRATSTFTCSTQLSPYQRANLVGTRGRIEVEIPFTPLQGAATRVWHKHGEDIEEISIDPCDQYMLEVDAYCRAILNDTPVPTRIEDAVANLRVIEAIVHSHRNGGWARVQA